MSTQASYSHHRLSGVVVVVKVAFWLYPVLWATQSDLPFIQTCSNVNNLYFPGRHTAMLQFMQEDISTTVRGHVFSYTTESIAAT